MVLLAAAAGLLIAFAACDRGPRPPEAGNARGQAQPEQRGEAGDSVAAVINGEAVTWKELELFAREILPDFKGESRAEWNEAIDMLINNRLLSRKAAAAKVDAAPRVRSKADMAANAVWEVPYWNAVVRPGVKLTEEDYRKRAPRFSGALTVRQMVVSDRGDAESLRAAVMRDRGSFERLVKERSEGLTAHQGGVVSNVTKESPQYSKEILDRLFAMNPKEISPVMKSEIGYTFFEVMEKVTPEEMERRWRKEITPVLLKDKELEVWEKHLDGLVAKCRVRVHRGAINAYLAARGKGGDLTRFANKPAFTIDNTTFYLGELVDPSAVGVVHAPGTLETIVNKKVRQYAVAKEVDRIGLKAKFPQVALRERFLRENVLARAYIDYRAQGIAVTDAEIREYYQKNRAKFFRPKIYEISAIETRSPDRVKEIYRELREGKDFGDVAEKWSDNRDRQPRGRVGPIREDRLSKEFAPAIKSLGAGQVAEKPVELPLAEGKKLYVILRLDGIRKEGYIPYSQVNRDDIRKAITARKREDVVKTVMEELRRENKVEIRPEYYRLADGAAEKNRRAGRKDGHHS